MQYVLYTVLTDNDGVCNVWDRCYPVLFSCARVSDCNTAFSFWLGAEADTDTN